MDPTLDPSLAQLVSLAERDPDVLAVLLFGSRARGDATPRSDTDVCLVLSPGLGAEDTAGRKRLEYLSQVDLDVAVFQAPPFHIRIRVLKEGRVLFVRDEDALYDVAIRTVRAFEDFKHIQRLYLDEVARG